MRYCTRVLSYNRSARAHTTWKHCPRVHRARPPDFQPRARLSLYYSIERCCSAHSTDASSKPCAPAARSRPPAQQPSALLRICLLPSTRIARAYSLVTCFDFVAICFIKERGQLAAVVVVCWRWNVAEILVLTQRVYLGDAKLSTRTTRSFSPTGNATGPTGQITVSAF